MFAIIASCEDLLAVSLWNEN